MTNCVEKKRSIPNTISTEGLHKYFKPLREISNHQIASSVTESENSNNIQTDSSAELCLPLTSIPSTVANTHESAVNNEQTLLHLSSKISSVSISRSNSPTEFSQCVVIPHSQSEIDIDVYSCNIAESVKNKCKYFSL